MNTEDFISNELSKLVAGLCVINFEDGSKSFMDLGLDSFGFIEFIQEIERVYGFEFSPEDITNPEIYTPKGLKAFIDSRR